MKNKLVLENGKEYLGLNFGYEREVKGEIFFSTAILWEDCLYVLSFNWKLWLSRR